MSGCTHFLIGKAQPARCCRQCRSTWWRHCPSRRPPYIPHSHASCWARGRASSWRARTTSLVICFPTYFARKTTRVVLKAPRDPCWSSVVAATQSIDDAVTCIRSNCSRCVRRSAMQRVNARVSDPSAVRVFEDLRAPGLPSAVDEHASPHRGLDHAGGPLLLAGVVDRCELSAPAPAFGLPALVGHLHAAVIDEAEGFGSCNGEDGRSVARALVLMTATRIGSILVNASLWFTSKMGSSQLMLLMRDN